MSSMKYPNQSRYVPRIGNDLRPVPRADDTVPYNSRFDGSAAGNGFYSLPGGATGRGVASGRGLDLGLQRDAAGTMVGQKRYGNPYYDARTTLPGFVDESTGRVTENIRDAYGRIQSPATADQDQPAYPEAATALPVPDAIRRRMEEDAVIQKYLSRGQYGSPEMYRELAIVQSGAINAQG